MDKNEVDKFLAIERVVDVAPKMYLELYHELVANINSENFTPLFTTLKETGSEFIKNPEKLTQDVRSYILSELIKLHDNFWSNSDINDALIALDMYKNHTKHCESKDRVITRTEPMRRTRPIRMRMKEKAKQFLEAQIRNQEIDIQNALETNKMYREGFIKIMKERDELRDLMKQCRGNFETYKTKILQITTQLLDNNTDVANENFTNI